MHAISLSIILPGFLAAIWIWPQLRRPWIWMSIGLLTLIGTAVWLGIDYQGDVAAKRPTDRLPRRLVFKIISQDLPIMQLFLAGLITGTWSWFCRNGSYRVGASKGQSNVDVDNATDSL